MPGSKIIALDALGGDRGARIPVEAAVQACRAGARVTLVGDEKIIRGVLNDLGGVVPRGLDVAHASEAIGMDEKPSQAVRKKRDSSLSVAARLVADGRADATISAGNSGAAMAAGLFECGRISGVERPAIASAFPTQKQPVVFLDLGANIDPSPVQLAQFAVLGEAYARAVLGRDKPRVALLANGSEEVKGSDLTRGAHELLSRAKISYAGYCEGRDIFVGDLDVVVTDGFTGNVLLKTLEGFVSAVRAILEREVRGSFAASAGALLMRNILGTVKKKLDYEEAGAAPLLGLKRNCLVAHGASTVNALMHAIASAEALARTPLIETIEASIQANRDLW